MHGFETGHSGWFIGNYPDGERSLFEVQILTHREPHMRTCYNIFRVQDGDDSGMPLPMHFFGTADGGNSHLLMDGADPSNNAVFVWEGSDDPWGEDENSIGLAKVADTLYEFYINLRPYEEL